MTRGGVEYGKGKMSKGALMYGNRWKLQTFGGGHAVEYTDN